MTDIRHRSSYDTFLSIISLVYTRHIPKAKGIYLTYVWHISVICILSWYKPGICQVYVYYTWRLVLRWWARPHTAWTTCNNISGPSHDAYFFYIGATASFTLAHVDVDGAFRHKEGSQPLLLARRTNVAGCYCSCKWPCLVRCHCCSTEQDDRSVNSDEQTLVSNPEFRHMIYDKYIPGIYHLLGPDPNQRVTGISTGDRRIRSFYRPFPLSKFQRHFQLYFRPPCTPCLYHLISGISPDCCRIMTRFFKTRLKLHAATQSNEQGR